MLNPHPSRSGRLAAVPRSRGGLPTAVRAIVLLAAALFSGAPATADEMVPFQAQAEGFAAPVFNPDGTVNNTEVAVGQASHLGLFAWTSEEFAVFTGPTQLSVVGAFTMTGANGDQVFGSYVTVGTIAFPTITILGQYLITGGTGRFANATGSGTITATGNLLDPFEIVGALSGTISQPNS